MKTLTSFRDAGSFIAGLVIGVSFVITVFAMTVVDAGRGQIVGVIIAVIIAPAFSPPLSYSSSS